MIGGGGTARAGAYEAAGVDYGTLDAAKRDAIEAAASTLRLPELRGASVVAGSVGEPATLIEIGSLRLAVVLECLGTKSAIAHDLETHLSFDPWPPIGIDAVAAIVNDLACVGAVPLTVNAYFATGSPSWYSGHRHSSLVAGWRQACQSAGAAWVGGESPTLSGLVHPEQIDIAGSALGRIPDGRPAWLGASLSPGDEIVLVASNGLHANGASLARAVAASPAACPAGWAEPLPSGRSFGEAMLDPSALYPGLVEALHSARVPVHYASHVTGHGLRKVMRADRELTYRVRELPPVPESLAFLASRAGLDAREAYGTLNMGVGFALFLGKGSGIDAVAAAQDAGHHALVAGVVEEGARRVVLEPLGVTYEGPELALR